MRNTKTKKKGGANVKWSAANIFMPYADEMNYRSPTLGGNASKQFSSRLRKSNVGKRILTLASSH